MAPCVKNKSGEVIPVTSQTQRYMASKIFKEIKGASEDAVRLANSRMATIALLKWVEREIDQRGCRDGIISHPQFGFWFLEWKKKPKKEEPVVNVTDWEF